MSMKIIVSKSVVKKFIAMFRKIPFLVTETGLLSKNDSLKPVILTKVLRFCTFAAFNNNNVFQRYTF